MPLNNTQMTKMFQYIDPTWKTMLITENKAELEQILNTLSESVDNLCPAVENVFNAFRLIPYADTKIVIVGQDPYYTTYNASAITRNNTSTIADTEYDNTYTNNAPDMSNTVNVDDNNTQTTANVADVINNTNEFELNEFELNTPELNEFELNTLKLNATDDDDFVTSEPTAHGLSFSSKDNKIPPSLRNIYSCLINNKHIDGMPTTSDLTAWASQGILMLNKSLTTTTIGRANVHKELWNNYTQSIIRQMCKKKEDDGKFLIFLLWGKDAQTLEPIIGNKHIIMKWCHPSPMAQTSLPRAKQFVSCTHFGDVNDIVTPHIDWNPHASVYIYTDGACTTKKTPNVGGWSFHVSGGMYDGIVHYGNISTIYVDDVLINPTNQRGEGLAFINTLQFILDKRIMHDTTIVTDSQFYINVLTNWMHSWYKLSPAFTIKKDGGSIKNKDIIMQLYNLYNKVVNKINLKIIHTNSHKKAPDDTSSIEYQHWYGNFIADMYASKGSELSNDKVKCININDTV